MASNGRKTLGGIQRLHSFVTSFISTSNEMSEIYIVLVTIAHMI